jgi:oligoendopeptidase F
MDYKGYNIAVHELGHNVEQVFSLNAMDYWWLNGVPNTAFTEALAFVFQNRDLELLGLGSEGADSGPMEALDTLWSAAEIGGVALVDMGVWRWMYRHPQATPAELREATLDLSRTVWNKHFAPVFGVRNQDVLAVYSHMIVYGLYLPDYPIGHIIAFQLAEEFRGGDFGEQFERISRQGRLTPDAWMRGAVGQPISASVLLSEARKALD